MSISECDVPEGFFEIFEGPDNFNRWANSKYPHSFSLMGEYMDTEISEAFWDCYTYNPKLTEEEITRIMHEFIEEHK